MVAGWDLDKLHKTAAKQAFAPGTYQNHIRQFKLYLMFCQHFHLQDIDPTPRTLCLYVEFLASTFCSPKAIRNYISAVRLLHKYLGAQATSFDCFEMKLMLRAIDNTLSHTLNQRLPITIDILQALCSTSDRISGSGLVLKFAFFLRQSNLAPRSARSFDKRKHTCREDIIMNP